MPYARNSDLPSGVKDALPSEAQSIFRNVANSLIYDGKSEESAFKQAWGAVKRNFKHEGGKWVAKDQEELENKLELRVAKIDEELGLVFGWAIVCKVDGEDYYDLNIDRDTRERVPEHIPEGAMLKAATEFMQTARPGNEMHTGPDRGSYVFAFPMTTDIAKSLGIETRNTGLIVAYKPPPDVLAKFKNGTYRGFSIEGITRPNGTKEVTDG